jgi:hypothetical protein
MPTPGQIQRAWRVSRWRWLARIWSVPYVRFHDYDPVEVMEGMGSVWPLDDFYDGPDLRPDQYPPNLPYTGTSVKKRIISNPPRPQHEQARPGIEMPDDFPY